MIHLIQQWDLAILKLVNHSWQNRLFDEVLPIFRISETWLPLYLFMLVLVIVNFRKNVLQWFLTAALVPAITDGISSHIIKETFYRVRPCRNPDLASWLHVPQGIYLPMSSSFTSSHATNHFGIAVFFIITLRPFLGKWVYLLLLWAALICYTQLYVGVHYPSDILAGACIGSMLGWGIARLLNRFFPLGLQQVSAAGNRLNY